MIAACGRTDPHGGHAIPPRTVNGPLGPTTTPFCAGNLNVITERADRCAQYGRDWAGRLMRCALPPHTRGRHEGEHGGPLHKA